MFWYGMVYFDMVWYGMVCFGMVWYGLVWFDVLAKTPGLYLVPELRYPWFGLVWYGLVWYGMVWFGMVWFGLVQCPCENPRSLSSPRAEIPLV